MLELKNLTVKTKNKTILKNIDYTFEKGKIYALMGPNGSGKSTLANAIMGHPSLIIDNNSDILFENESIKDLSPDKRAKKGIFTSFQSPLSLSGINIYQLLQNVLDKDIRKIDSEIKELSHQLAIPEGLLHRSLNENASGGERKKMEVLQAAMLNPKLVIFDEIDTGVDIDAMKTIADFINKTKQDKTYILITHYNRILKHLTPDRVLILKDGTISETGDAKLAEEIEEKGYGKKG